MKSITMGDNSFDRLSGEDFEHNEESGYKDKIRTGSIQLFSDHGTILLVISASKRG